MKINKLKLSEVANILANEASLLHCTLEKAWNGISKDITNQFKFKKIESYIIENIKQCNF